MNFESPSRLLSYQRRTNPAKTRSLEVTGYWQELVYATGRQNDCVRQTWQGYYVRVLSWSSLNTKQGRMYSLRASSLILASRARTRERRRSREGPRKESLLSLPRSPLSRLLSSAPIFHDIPQMRTCLQLKYIFYFSCKVSTVACSATPTLLWENIHNTLVTWAWDTCGLACQHFFSNSLIIHDVISQPERPIKFDGLLSLIFNKQWPGKTFQITNRLALFVFVSVSNQRQLESHPSFLRPIFS